MKARALLLMAIISLSQAAFSAEVASSETPKGRRILVDKTLFPKNPAQPEPVAMLDVLKIVGRDDRARRWLHIGLEDAYAPLIEAVISKYGKPDKIVSEARDPDDPEESIRTPHFVHYWGEYGLAVVGSDSTGKVKWVCRRIAETTP